MNLIILLVIHVRPSLFHKTSIKKPLNIQLEILFIFGFLLRLFVNRQRIHLNYWFDDLLLFLTVNNDFFYSLDYFTEGDFLNSPAKESASKISFTKKGIYGSIKLLTVRISVFWANFFDFRESLFIQQAVLLVLLMRFFINISKYLLCHSPCVLKFLDSVFVLVAVLDSLIRAALAIKQVRSNIRPIAFVRILCFIFFFYFFSFWVFFRCSINLVFLHHFTNT